MEYAKRLSDPRWQKKRLEVLSRDHFKCQKCSATDRELHVHHKYYLDGYSAWEYDDSCYITLCFKCHESEEAFLKKWIPCLVELFKYRGFMSEDFRLLMAALENGHLSTNSLPDAIHLMQYQKLLKNDGIDLFAEVTRLLNSADQTVQDA